MQWYTGHPEAAETAVLEALSRNVPGAVMERVRLLWSTDKAHRAVQELSAAVQQSFEDVAARAAGGGAAAAGAQDNHNRAKQLLQLAQWMAAVGQGGRDILVGLVLDGAAQVATGCSTA